MSAQLDITRIKHFLKREKQDSIHLNDIVRLAELMTDSMLDILKGNDQQTFEDLRKISYQISDTKRDLAEFRADEMHEEHIPQAGRELDAVVDATESATNKIMEAAETIMGGDPSDPDAYSAMVNDKVIEIFEACSFQDITGQRISKVVKTLNMIDEQIKCIVDRMDNERKTEEKGGSRPTGESLLNGLLNGPALKGDGINQDEVDSHFS